MNTAYIFPACSIALNLGSAGVFAWKGDLRLTIYWLAAATLTSCVTLGVSR